MIIMMHVLGRLTKFSKLMVTGQCHCFNLFEKIKPNDSLTINLSSGIVRAKGNTLGGGFDNFLSRNTF